MSKLILMYEKNIETKIFEPYLMNFKFLVRLARDFSGLKEKEIVFKIHTENSDVILIKNDMDIKNFTKNFFTDYDIRIEIIKNENDGKHFNNEKNVKNLNEDSMVRKNSLDLIIEKNIEKIPNEEDLDLNDPNENIHEVLRKFERFRISDENIDLKSKKIKKLKVEPKENIKKNIILKHRMSSIKNDLKEFCIKPNPSINFGSTNYKFKISKKKIEKEIINKKEKDSTNKVVIHDNIICFSCQLLPIVGKRYKCMICFNYDLCENCERILYHSHPMVRLVEKMDKNFTNYINNLNLETDIIKDNEIINQYLIKEKKELLEFMYGDISNDEKNKLVAKYPNTNIEEFYKSLTRV